MGIHSNFEHLSILYEKAIKPVWKCGKFTVNVKPFIF